MAAGFAVSHPNALLQPSSRLPPYTLETLTSCTSWCCNFYLQLMPARRPLLAHAQPPHHQPNHPAPEHVPESSHKCSPGPGWIAYESRRESCPARVRGGCAWEGKSRERGSVRACMLQAKQTALSVARFPCEGLHMDSKPGDLAIQHSTKHLSCWM